MTRIGQYLLGSPYRSALIVFLCSLLSLFGIPLVNWFALVVMALVTLRIGHSAGLFVLAWLVLPDIALLFLDKYSIVIIFLLLQAVSVYLTAWLLRVTQSWQSVFVLSTIVATFAVVIIHLLVPDITNYWLAQLSEMLLKLQEAGSEQITSRYPEFIARLFTGLMVAGVLVSNFLTLLFARAWQSSMFNKGGLSAELFSLSLPSWLSFLALASLIAALFDVTIGLALVPLFAIVYACVGLVLCHSLSLKAQKSWRTGALVTVYVLLVFFFPYVAIMLALFGLSDSWVNFRRLLSAR